MKVLLTGSTGFLGRHLKSRLEHDGHSLDLIGRGANLAWHSNPDAIIHCAAELDKPEKMIDSNLGLVVDLLEHAKEHGCRMIQIGSSSETGPTEGPRSETDFCCPTTLYEATKLAATNLCLGYAGQYGLDVCVARPFSLYGPNDKPRKFLPALLRAYHEKAPFHVYPGGHDWLYVDDFVEGIVKLLGAPREKTKGQVYHFGSGISTSNSDVVKCFERAIGGKVNTIEHTEKYRPYDVLDWRADWRRAGCELGWEPTVSLEEGMRRFINDTVL